MHTEVKSEETDHSSDGDDTGPGSDWSDQSIPDELEKKLSRYYIALAIQV